MRARVWVLGIAAILVGMLTLPPVANSASASEPTVALSAAGPWIGMNVWGLAAAPDVFTCGASGIDHTQYLSSTFDHLRAAGVSVVRFWAFQSYATDESGSRNWAALDRVFSVAEAHGISLIPVLGNNWADCDYWPITAYPNGGHRKDATNWYASAYDSPYDGYKVGYSTWVSEITRRYSGRRSLAAWELVNEPQAASYSDADSATLASFLQRTRDAVRGADTQTAISLGSMGTGQPGFDNGRYAAMLTNADLGTAHDYGYPDEPLPRQDGCTSNCVRTDLADTLAAGKRFYVGEAGIDGCDSALRTSQLLAKMDAAFTAGASGHVFWAYDDRTLPSDCGFDVGPQSALIVALTNRLIPTATPTVSATAMVTPTASVAPTGTPAASVTASPSATPTPKTTATATATPSCGKGNVESRGAQRKCPH